MLNDGNVFLHFFKYFIYTDYIDEAPPCLINVNNLGVSFGVQLVILMRKNLPNEYVLI